jgi:hypothetical protein
MRMPQGDHFGPIFSPSPRRKPGAMATSELLQSWIPAFAGMTKERGVL